MKCLSVILIVLTFGLAVRAKEIQIQVLDSLQGRIEGATCLVFSMPDSIFYNYSTTDNNGISQIETPDEDWYLRISHLGFQPLTLNRSRYEKISSDSLPYRIIMIPTHTQLKEIEVKAEKSHVSMTDGMISYVNLDDLRATRVLANAHDLLQALPLITSSDGTSLTISGAPMGSVVYINGKRSLMATNELMQYLKNIPADQIESVDIIYTPSPRWKTKSSVINVRLKRQQTYTLNGQVNVSSTLKQELSGTAGGAVFIGLPKLSFNLTYSVYGGKSIQKSDTYSRHTFGSEIYEIKDTTEYHSKYDNHQLYAQLEYEFNKSHSIGAAYNGYFTPHSKTVTNSHNSLFGQYNTAQKSQDILNALSFYYSATMGVDAGVQFNRYNADSHQDIYSYMTGFDKLAMISSSEQKVSQFHAYVDVNTKLPRKWTLLYGASYTFSRNDNKVFNLSQSPDMMGEDKTNRTHENRGDLYTGLQKSFIDGKLFFRVSIKADLYSMMDDNNWQLLPNILLTYRPETKHYFQLAFQSYKSFPSLWQRQDYRSYQNPYTVFEGNPGLRPTTTRTAIFVYLFKRKYAFTTYYTHVSDYFLKQPFQTPDKLTVLYKLCNIDFFSTWNASVTMPFNIGKSLYSKIVLRSEFTRSKANDWNGLSFDRSKLSVYAWIDNNFIVCSNPRISVNVAGMYRSPVMFGVWERGDAWLLNAGVSASFLKNNLTIKFQGYDLLQTMMPVEKIRLGTQYRDVNSNYFTRSFGLDISWAFNGYKNVSKKNVDTSRYGID